VHQLTRELRASGDNDTLDTNGSSATNAEAVAAESNWVRVC